MLVQLSKTCTIKDVKEAIGNTKSNYKDINRQELRQEPKGKALKDEAALSELAINTGAMLYFKDRGLQIGWTTVFLCEYAGPLFVYLWVATRPWLLYGDVSSNTPYQPVVRIAAACWTFHYAKRVLETLFVHRFSNATMPINNLFKNCSYYWGFAAYVSYHVNHPLFTAPSDLQVYAGLAAFLVIKLHQLVIFHHCC
jgi:very-long-chain enoyl-CoA reductase